MIDPRVLTLCKEFSIEIVSKSTYPMPGQTRAVETISRILRRYGEAHTRLVLTTLKDTANNGRLLDEAGLWMASDMIRVRGEDRVDSEFLALWDAMPLGQLQFIAHRLSGLIPVRYALGGMVYERLYRRLEKDMPDQMDWLDDRWVA